MTRVRLALTLALALSSPALSSLALSSLARSPRAEARVGDWGDPIEVRELPFTHAGDTRGREARVDAYDCAPGVSEEGPEVVYRVAVPAAGELRAWVEGDGGGVDVDVQVLSRAQLGGRVAQGCLARHNALAAAAVGAGEVWVVVDSYAGAAQAGAYRLRVDHQPRDGWYRRLVAQGVSLETREYASLFGGRQTASVLRVDLSAPGVSVRPLGGVGCATTSALGRAAGAVAAVNAGFFSLNGRCDSLSLLKVDGALLSRNARGRASFGVTAEGAPRAEWVAAGADWPAARQAVGGLSRLVAGGAVDVQWERDGATSDFTFGRNPRTAVGFVGAEVILGTLDGRTGAGLGVSLPDLAQWMVWLGAQEAVNLDGGGSTTLWARGEPAGGVVNFPSDNGLADHAGERAVSTALGVFAPPLAREAVWVARPGAAALAPGEAFEAELWARDPDGEPLRLWARTAGRGALSLEPSLDGAGVVRYVASPADEARVELVVEALAGERVDGVWRVALSV
ncbi:MAG: phosphodiester glycosidase family protein, partial [Deltaproteobacteria bacterium]|nr:phosphodiester glycosidase family protein [Deltaproteobacteria bacterium]